MLKTKLNFFMSAVIAGSLLASAVYAATDGKESKTSTGTVDILLTLKENIKISGMRDIKVDRRTKSVTDKFVYGLTGVCITSKDETEYNISAGSTSVGQGYFQLTGSGGGKINYSLLYTVVPPGQGVNEGDVSNLDEVADSLSEWPGKSLGGAGSNFKTVATGKTDLTCSTGTYNGVLWVKVPDTNMATAATGDYRDTVTVTVSPV